MKKFRADVEIEETRDGGSVVTLRGRHGNVLGKFRLAPEGSSTMTRAADAAARGEEADNYWICLKPSDGTVFGTCPTCGGARQVVGMLGPNPCPTCGGEGRTTPLFDPRATLTVEDFRFRIWRKR